jgi:hypothetical protein
VLLQIEKNPTFLKKRNKRLLLFNRATIGAMFGIHSVVIKVFLILFQKRRLFSGRRPASGVAATEGGPYRRDTEHIAQLSPLSGIVGLRGEHAGLEVERLPHHARGHWCCGHADGNACCLGLVSANPPCSGTFYGLCCRHCLYGRRAQDIKVFWFFFSKKNIFSFATCRWPPPPPSRTVLQPEHELHTVPVFATQIDRNLIV